MKAMISFRLLAAGVISLAVLGGTSCMTTYDAYGNPVQSVDPGAAAAGALAAGVIGYAIADDNDGHRHYRGRSYHRPRPYYHPGYRGW